MLALVDAGLRGTLVALSLLLAGVLLRDRPPTASRLVSVAMALGLCIQTMASTPLLEARVPLFWRAPFIALSVGNAPLFWVFVCSLVDDDFVLRRRHLAAWLVVVGFTWFVMAIVVGSGWPATQLCLVIQRTVAPFFAVLTAITATLNRRADLVERRRWLRSFVVWVGVSYTLVMIVFRARSPHGQLSGLATLLDLSFLLLIVAVVASQLLRLGGSELFLPLAAAAAEPGELAPPSVAPLEPPDPAEQRLADALQRAMAADRAYRTEDLTVALLAAKLAVPEYRLRRLINQRLGHRNFNAFVNGFRLDEARAALVDPAKRDLPILTIALDAGFGSIGPFNRAFKTATGLTPGEFRRAEFAQEKLADS
ncbi:MAG: helix-turn-helix domain-containing protein [Burkholderiales bacterium]